MDSTSTADLRGHALRLVQAQKAQRCSSTPDHPHKYLGVYEYPREGRQGARLLPGIPYMVWISGNDGSINLMHTPTGIDVHKWLPEERFTRVGVVDTELFDSTRYGTMIFVSFKGVRDS
jgi:hypothetical protein